mmetsp:Transcript_87068/g.224217  ORF Transcript_87068/g.224217 Transcript_87068/m.224217 type:complete len:237 (+) Transcript_87068:940-1650(+)
MREQLQREAVLRGAEHRRAALAEDRQGCPLWAARSASALGPEVEPRPVRVRALGQRSLRLDAASHLQSGELAPLQAQRGADPRVAGARGRRLLRHRGEGHEAAQAAEHIDKAGDRAEDLLEVRHGQEVEGDDVGQGAQGHLRPQAAKREECGERAEAERHARLHPGLGDIVHEVLAPDGARRIVVVPGHEVCAHAIRTDGDAGVEHHGLEVLNAGEGAARVEHQRRCGSAVQAQEI